MIRELKEYSSKKRIGLSLADQLIIFAALFTILILIIYQSQPAYGQEEISIKEVQRVELGDSQYKAVIKYCKQNTQALPVGMLVSSDIGKAAIAVDKNLRKGDCQLYVTKINSSKPSFVKATLFEQNEVPDILQQFNQRLKNFEDKKINALKDLRIEKSSPEPDAKKIDRLEKNIMRFDQSIQNTKSSIRLLSSYLI